VQVLIAPVPLRVQLAGVKLPLPLLAKLTLPVGVLVVPESVSVTVALQLVADPTFTEVGVQLTDVVVVLPFTVKPLASVAVPPPPPLPAAFVTDTVWPPSAAAVPILILNVNCVLVALGVGAPTMKPGPKLTCVLAVKPVPVNVTVLIVCPGSPLFGDTLVNVGATAVVEYVAV
jgi:hypothetical protein